MPMSAENSPITRDSIAPSLCNYLGIPARSAPLHDSSALPCGLNRQASARKANQAHTSDN
jgi:hypothetical protein